MPEPGSEAWYASFHLQEGRCEHQDLLGICEKPGARYFQRECRYNKKKSES